MKRPPQFDRDRCMALIKGKSTDELVAKPFRDQMRALLVELGRRDAAIDQLNGDNRRLLNDNRRLLPAADAVLEWVKKHAHSDHCVCPLCRSIRGYREIVQERVAAYRAKSGAGS